MNEFLYLYYNNPFGNFADNLFPEISILYQFIFMWNTKCNIDETTNGKVLTGWSYESHNENSNIEKIHFKFWDVSSNPADTIWIISYITLPNDDYCYYGPSFHFWNRTEADRYLKFIRKLFKTGFTTKKIKSESLMSWGT